MKELLLLAVAVAVLGVIELVKLGRHGIAMRGELRSLVATLERLERDTGLDEGLLAVLVDRHRRFKKLVADADDPHERTALVEAARRELGPAGEALRRPEYDRLALVRLDALRRLDRDVQRRIVRAVQARVLLERWRPGAVTDPPGAGGLAPNEVRRSLGPPIPGSA